ncbi:MAG TPA: AI-2E family transporter [Candidatus Baltobacteraceae bacterium]|nr:AI-2E family transporter [Candidatus Baltobacteraceae bacterium]
MQEAVSPAGWRRILWIVAAVAILIAAWIFIEHIPRTITIFLIAAFIAFGVQPIARRLENERVPKALAVSIVFVVLLLLIVVGLVVIVPLTIAQMQVLGTNMPLYIAGLQSWLASAEIWMQGHIPGLRMPAGTLDIGRLGSSRLSELATGTIASLGAILLGTATAFFVAFSSIVLSFFFLLNDAQIAENFAAMFPLTRRETARKLAAEITETFGSYISGQVIVSAITGIVVAVLSAVIGFKFSLILGIVTAVAYAIPVIGMLIAQAIAVVLCAPQGGWMILWVQVIMFAMARISDNVLVPKIMGSSVGVSPIGVMFAVFAGGELFGIPGLLLGIPAAALIKILWRYFAAPWMHSQLGKR